MSNIFFYSDPHFYHKSILKFCKNRPFDSLEEMHEGMIKKYNQVVKKGDVVYWVGDCFFSSKKPEMRAIMDRLNGTKVLIRGNHDFKTSIMINAGFAVVCDYMVMKICNLTVRIKHYPYRYYDSVWQKWYQKVMRISPKKIKYWDHRLENDGTYLIHGHTHSTEKFNGNQIHVGCDAWDCAPVSIKEIERHISRMENLKRKAANKPSFTKKLLSKLSFIKGIFK